jgi:hypothetical protein
MALAPFLNPLMLGPAKVYRGIPADTVAAAMITAAGTGAPAGISIPVPT